MSVSEDQSFIDSKNAFDGSINTLQRINYALWNCNQHRERMEVLEWGSKLQTLYAEVIIYVKKEDEEKKITELFNKIKKHHADYIKKSMNKGNSSFNHYEDYFEFEMELRRNAKSLLMREIDTFGATA